MKPKRKKKVVALTDYEPFPFGEHRGQMIRHVPAIYLLNLVGTPELAAHPEVAGYIERAIRQLNAEAKQARLKGGDHD